MNVKVLDVHEKPQPIRWLALSLQHMFAMFGATILVPQLVGLSPAIALLTSGIATIVFIIVTKFQVPAYLGSSFAFIVPIQMATQSGGIGSAMIGSMFVALVYAIISLLIYKTGYHWIMKLLPPIVVGPVIMVIGLALAPTAINMASTINVDGADVYSGLHFSAALVTLASAVFCLMFFKGIISLMPVLIGIVVGYIYSAFIGILDFSKVVEAKWFAVPDMLIPGVDYEFVVTPTLLIIMVPIAIVTISEHIGHQLVLGKVVNRNYIESPGLHRSLLGDGLGTLMSGLVGGPPKTTYGENIGVLAITRVYSVYVILGAAVFAIIFSFIGKIMALIATIPTAVLGGISILLFGIIASSGIRMLIDHKIDFDNQRNLVIASIILVIGIGGATINISETFQIGGMALAAIVGVLLNLVLPGKTDDTLMDKEE
ncbi:uracil permease [Sporosarcina sp. P21c]|uniref:uracil-xanthine permease family protein n=1 Tax=Sporosarcina TaxID=1569 RepID=UPI000A164145|nr:MULTISPECIES: solute carrier family 23 protein [Sporosarcina]ARJ39978.1 uracil permease [Sporosarcina ureae]PIC68829.1 uracil permease [Sporosarcina sp. P16a]PIC84402.1 uracil permease [Sporosarcina sp. P1]PIC90053.1 uracil permease [Sporosarcina sp. P21c]PIC92154.1 uracil permease [Sporosarcina sp. P25]